MSKKQVQRQQLRKRIIQMIKQQQKTYEITYDKIYNDKKFTSLIALSQHQSIGKIKLLIKSIFKDHPKILAGQTVKWKKKYPNVIDQKSLFKQIQQQYRGFQINQDLKYDTYQKAKEHINQALIQGKIKKILSSNKNTFYVFPAKLQKKYKIKENSTQFDHGTNFYLKVCRQSTIQSTTLNTQTQSIQNSIYKGHNTKQWNSWVPGYMDMKQQWLKKNNKN